MLGRACAACRALWGAEARIDLSLGWAYPLTVRLGVGVPMLAAGRGVLGRSVLPYVDFGTFI